MAAIELAFDLFCPDAPSDLPPVVLIHCLVETRHTWKHIGPEIAKATGRKVFAIDCRNHGDSPWTGDYSSDIMTADLDAFLTWRRIPRAVIVGHSIGGVVAMQFAVSQPHKVEKLIVEDSPARRSAHKSSNFVPFAIDLLKEAYAHQPRGEGEEAAFQFVNVHFRQLAPFLKCSEDLIDTYDRGLLPFHWNGEFLELKFSLDAVGRAVTEDKLVRELGGAFSGEALFLFGAESQFKVGQDLLIAKHFPNAVKVGFENVGHFIHHEYPKEFIRVVTNFINNESKQVSKL